MSPQKPPSLGFFPKIVRQAPGIDLSGQVAIITGANSGLGFHSARHLLALNLSHLILAVRSKKNGEEAMGKLQKEFPSARLEVWELEMTSYDSIQAFARRIETALSRLDIIILLAHSKLTICESTGHDGDIQVNYLSTFLLTILILQALKKKQKSPTSSPPRLTIVSSGTALTAKLPNRNKRPLLASFDDPYIQPYDTLERYGASKLLGHLFFARLLKYLDPDDAIVNLVQPGLVKGTGLFREAPIALGVIFSVIKTFTALSVEDGAWLYVDAAVVRGKESHGRFCSEGKIQPFASLVYTAEGGPVLDALWEETMSELDFAGVREMLQG
ncbi:putative short-chain dehydrogenase/reductase family protein [Mollisia scopiformis]|uniref:Putative short-chain dehydrogenase/reductase family protein n=1 Tax=Mollisia scopiformis TaxID=149040 RepID=A0A194XUX8_MOLSC|nr:putative short-chain dehydrogenase/reductase family protein [Mollisia scopiformis]KUJ24013.1 putative short-chain dehydrogenase/reductase family protein [Mollisia scopiformis]